VVVVDNFPSTEVKALLQMANAAGDAADKAGGSSAVPRSLLQPARSNLPAGTTSFFVSLCGTDKVHLKSLQTLSLKMVRFYLCDTDLPIARRNSLHRFLEKRKGRYLIFTSCL
jgi:jasmonate ZIM domain-containing protein